MDLPPMVICGRVRWSASSLLAALSLYGLRTRYIPSCVVPVCKMAYSLLNYARDVQGQVNPGHVKRVLGDVTRQRPEVLRSVTFRT